MTNNPQSNAQDSSSGISQVADQRDCRRRKAHHKVKTGCQSCKTRRQKCDERRPVCSGCERHSTTCIYQGKNRRSQPKSQAQTASSLESIDDDTLEASQILDFGSLRRAPPELNLVDLELMHQYLMSTCSIAVGQRPEMIAYHQMKMPRLGQAYPFVMRGILAMAATHLSWLKPSQQAHYAMIAARNHHAALPEFRSCLQDINKQNCYALVAYAKSILWCSFSGFRSSHSYKIGQNWFPEWFRLMHGSCHLVEISRPWIKEGPHVHQEVESTVDTSSSLPDDHRLSILMSRLSHLTSGSSLCKVVLTTLRVAFARACVPHLNTPVRSAMNYWVGNAPEEYMRLLKVKEPWALVVLAHFCILVKRLETVWFMEGNASRLLSLIVLYLDPHWRYLIAWPCQEIGYELERSVS